jgi:hypothetical protein
MPAPEGPQLNPTAMTPTEAAGFLSAASGEKVTPDEIEAAIQEGAPTNADGTVHLTHFAAWLVQQMTMKT